MNSVSSAEKPLPPEHDVCPCKHMEGMVTGYADGTLRGPARWYTQLHASYCKQCGSAIKNLRTVIDKVSDLKEENRRAGEETPASRRAGLERALDEVDASSKSKGTG